MAVTNKPAAVKPVEKPNEIRITRLYDAPLQLVWDAWTDPKQVAQWWGPRGFTITTHSKDLRVGGHWSYTMHGPDGTNWENKTLYHEVDLLRKLVYDHGGNDDRPPLFRVTVLFAEENGKTKMDMTMALKTAEEAEQTKVFIKKAGGNGTWDRLAEYLAKQATGREQFVIARTFEAPIDLMFDMWVDPKHLAQWLPPVGLEMEIIEGEIRTGSSVFYCTFKPGGPSMYGRVHFLEVRRPDRLVSTQVFCDEHGKTTRHPMAPVWPETMLRVVTLTAESPDHTRVTVTWEPHGPTTPAEIEQFVAGRAGMTQGWTGSFDKLEALLG